MVSTPRWSLLLGLTLVFVPPSVGQSSSHDANAPSPEVVSGGYVIHRSINLGVRVSDTNGSAAIYDTLVDLHTGPRILDQTFTMRSQDHQSIVLGNLYINSVGWGGNPDNFLRLRADKDKWYDFRASFRRDQDFFDYNLATNPLNPTTSVPNVPVLMSPHPLATGRRMSDFDLTLLPQYALSFRLGYSRNSMSGQRGFLRWTDRSPLLPRQ